MCTDTILKLKDANFNRRLIVENIELNASARTIATDKFNTIKEDFNESQVRHNIENEQAILGV